MNERAIFFQALDRDDPTERAAYLDEACAGDAPLRQRIEALLWSHAKAAGFLDVPAPEQLAAEPDTSGRHARASHSATAPVPHPTRPKDRDQLDFLAPSQRPDSLGRLDHYEVLGVVGRGGMGVVLRASDEKLHRVVAVKALTPALAASESARQRFVREARAAAAVTHDNVVPLHAVEDDGPVPYLVMQLIDGPTLQQKLDVVRGSMGPAPGPLPFGEVVRIGREIASGLAAAHARGLVHRDIKPANILLEGAGERVKITDFGLARAADKASFTQSGVVAGTPAYMSPEQANGERVDPRSDLFSLGSVLYALCAGHPPFRAMTTMAVLRRVCEETPRPLREINEEIPEWFCGIVSRLHAKDPAQRFQTAAEVAEELGRRLARMQREGEALAEPGSDNTGPPAQRRGGIAAPGKTTSSARRLVACLALIGVGIVVAFGIFSGPDPTKNPDGPNGTAHEPPTGQPGSLEVGQRQPTLPANAPAELSDILGEPAHFPYPPIRQSHPMAQTADSRLLAVPWGSDVLLFEARTGKLLRTLPGDLDPALCPAFSPDGKHLAAGSAMRVVRIWDVETGRVEQRIEGLPHGVSAVVYAPDGSRLVSGDQGGMIHVWDRKGQPVSSFRAHTKRVNCLAFRSDGKRLASAALDGTCKIWNSSNWQEVHSLKPAGKNPEALAWHPTGQLLAVGDAALATIWNGETFDLVHTLEAPGNGLVAFTPDGRTLLTAPRYCRAGQKQAITKWDVKSGHLQSTCEIRPAVPDDVQAVYHLSADGQTVFASQDWPPDGMLGAYAALTGEARFPNDGHREGVNVVAYSPDGRTLASGGGDHTIRLWDTSGVVSGKPPPPCRRLYEHQGAVTRLTFSPDGGLLVSMSMSDGLVIVWDTATGKKLHRLEGSRLFSAAVFSPDGATLAATGVKAGIVNLWNPRTGNRKGTLSWNQWPLEWLAFSPDGRLLASSDERTLLLVDLKADRVLHTIRAETPFHNLAFSPDGRTLAGSSSGSGVRFWDTGTGQDRTSMRKHPQRVVGLAFQPDGKQLVTASSDGTMKITSCSEWLDTPLPLKEARTLDFKSLGPVNCAAFSPECRSLAMGRADGTVAILRVTP